MARLARSDGVEGHLLRQASNRDIGVSSGADIDEAAAIAQQRESLGNRHIVSDLDHDVGAAPVAMIAHPLTPIFGIDDLFQIQHAVRAHALGHFQARRRRADDQHLFGAVVPCHSGGEVAQRAAPLDDHDFVALDRSQPLETMHHGPVRAGGCRRRGGGDFFGDFDDQTRRRHVHVFGAASEEIGEPVAPVMPP